MCSVSRKGAVAFLVFHRPPQNWSLKKVQKNLTLLVLSIDKYLFIICLLLDHLDQHKAISHPLNATTGLVSPDYHFVRSLMDYFIITDKPEITVHPRSEAKTEGENLILSCDAEGVPAPTISWTRNGSLVDTSDNSRISFSADRKQLAITNVNRTDSGEYRCVANNSLGNDTSNPATLDVQCKYSDFLAKAF